MTRGSLRSSRWRLPIALAGIAVFALSTMPAQAHPHNAPAERKTIPSWTGAEDKPAQCSSETVNLIDETPAAFSLLGVTEAWKQSDGGVLVAVVDSGVAADNLHLSAAVLPGLDLVGGEGEGRIDVYGHGTAIAGQIAARAVAGSGLTGLAPQAMILPVRTFIADSPETRNAGFGPDDSRIAAGIRWAAEQNAKIIVVAQSSTTDLPELRESLRYATSLGSLVVASAGNASDFEEDPAAPRYPAAYPEALSVTAVDIDGAPTDAVLHGDHIDVAAPGEQVLTTYFGVGDCLLAGDKPTTSYATGYAAGVAALIASAFPQETPEEWKYRILASALRPSRSARDGYIGWGLVAPSHALNFINDGSLPGPPNPRFAPPQSEEPLRMISPQPTQDLRPARNIILVIIVGTGTLVMLATLLASRLRDLCRR